MNVYAETPTSWHYIKDAEASGVTVDKPTISFVSCVMTKSWKETNLLNIWHIIGNFCVLVLLLLVPLLLESGVDLDLETTQGTDHLILNLTYHFPNPARFPHCLSSKKQLPTEHRRQNLVGILIPRGVYKKQQGILIIQS